MAFIERSGINEQQDIDLFESIVTASRVITQAVNRENARKKRLNSLHGHEIRQVHDRVALIVTSLKKNAQLLDHVGTIKDILNGSGFIKEALPKIGEEMADTQLKMLRKRTIEINWLRKNIGLTNRASDLDNQSKFPNGWAVIVRGTRYLSRAPFNGNAQFLKQVGEKEYSAKKENQEHTGIEILLGNIGHTDKLNGNVHVTTVPLVALSFSQADSAKIELVSRNKQIPTNYWIFKGADALVSIKPPWFHTYLRPSK